MSEKTLRICHLYPDLLNLYGDRGNILCMRRRLVGRGMDAGVTEVSNIAPCTPGSRRRQARMLAAFCVPP